MILIDFSQIAYACTIEFLLMTKQRQADVALVRHMILNTIRAQVRKHKHKYGEVVIAYDSGSYWRKERFPHYKANRKKNRDKSPFDWTSIFSCMDTLREEYKKHLPYRVIEVEGTEADDVIGVLTYEQPMGSPVAIISGDKDFNQLQLAMADVTQHSPFAKGPLVEKAPPELVLMDHVIRGDSGDGIPNILSPDDVFVTGGRQKPIHVKKITEWLTKRPEEFCTTETMMRNYIRNRELIDLRCIPATIKTAIIDTYGKTTHATKGEFLNYLTASGLRELTGSIEDF